MATVLQIAAIALFTIAQPARAAPVETATFRVGGADFKLRVPTGYCIPTGKAADVAQIVAATDTTNVTDLTLYECDAGKVSYDHPILIKTPRNALLVTTTRPELLTGLGEAFDRPELKEALESGEIAKKSGADLSRVLGSEIGAAIAIKPVGRDALCGYLAGTISITDPSGTAVGAVAACITAVQGKILLIYKNGRFSDAASITSLIPGARALTAALIAQNEAK